MSLLILFAILAGAILFGTWLERRSQRRVLIVELSEKVTDHDAEAVADAIVDAFEDAGLRKPQLIIARGAHITLTSGRIMTPAPEVAAREPFEAGD
ncbi:hypothetical protein K9B35_14205 [Sphingomonas sp. R647]|uniref:hypothetical protein n=1 Tax=Sphingomonas sp. R647 TaxID=2875233 RepID=UPI001CD6E505|nr:hypothetical protein [Sphingomonas sp. R647]MCA1199126.1 hypothetical protein [Sphingomonas sp. R647]